MCSHSISIPFPTLWHMLILMGPTWNYAKIRRILPRVMVGLHYSLQSLTSLEYLFFISMNTLCDVKFSCGSESLTNYIVISNTAMNFQINDIRVLCSIYGERSQVWIWCWIIVSNSSIFNRVVTRNIFDGCNAGGSIRCKRLWPEGDIVGFKWVIHFT
jgi:hypothetical protein